VKLSLAPGDHKFTAEVVTDLGVPRSLTRDILVRRGTARPRETRLKVLTIAPSFQDPRIQEIAFADSDVKDLAAFLKRHLVSPATEKPIDSPEEEFLEGPTKAKYERVQSAIEALKKETFGEGDLLVVIVETHFLNVKVKGGTAPRLVAANTNSEKVPPEPMIPADDLGRSLGVLAARGCKVLVLLDSVHEASKNWDTDISDWVRNLRDVQNVITFVASNSGPSVEVLDKGHRAFAQAILDSTTPPLVKPGIYSLYDFRDTVIDRVLKFTERRQQAACYLPESIGGQFPLINPQSTGR
jgi:hypothetical protein